jgi:hypothetical protein
MASAIGSFKQGHHIVFGVALAAVGVFGMIGSVTGNLACMIAALFDPSILVDASSGGGGITGIPGLEPTNEEPPSTGTPIEPAPPAISPSSPPELGTGGAPWYDVFPEIAAG